MLSVLFTILMIGIFGKLIGFAFHAAWGLTKVVCTLVVLPVVLIVLVVAGFVALALPVLVIVGIVALCFPGDRVKNGFPDAHHQHCIFAFGFTGGRNCNVDDGLFF